MREEIQLQKQYIIFAFLLILGGLFINMGSHPLYHEEPRRAMIAWEMLQHHQWFTPTVAGEFYYKKPAFYNWLIAGVYSIFGVSEFTSRLLSQLAFIGLAFIGFLAGRRYVNTNFGIWNALLMLSCVDIVFYFSVTGAEIDLVFSFIIASMVYLLFKFYDDEKYLLMFTVGYTLAAIGTLTKSLPAIAFVGLTILILLYYHKDLKRLFSKEHFLGIAIYLLIVGGYFYIHINQNPAGLEGYISNMWKDSSERTVLEKSYTKLIVHLISFPFEVLKNVLPAGLLVLFCLRKDFMKKVKENKFVKYSFFFLIANLPLYYISPGARSRYTYMFFPFIVFILAYFYFQSEDKNPLFEKILKIIATVLSILLPLTFVVLIFLPQGEFISNLPIKMTLLAAMGAFIAWWHFKKKIHFMLAFVMMIALARIGFDFTVIPYRAAFSSQRVDKDDAQAMSEITQNNLVKLYKDTQISLTTIYYFQIFNNRILQVSEDIQPGDLVILDVKYSDNLNYEELYRFQYQDEEMLLAIIK
ncbi:MAG: hypothetical protein CMO01_23850 [Thalassobius sp.]|nr:hypothetical protein [Thalassovita sp.]